MLKYVKYNEETGLCTEIGTGTNTDFYKSIGMVCKDVEQSEVDGQWYLAEKCLHCTDKEKLEKAMIEKLTDLTNTARKFDNNLVNTDMFVTSSLGFKINADLRSQNNIKGLIDVGNEVVNFVDYDNKVRNLSQSDLKTLLVEVSKNGENLYKQKWAYAEQINACKTIEELEKIEFNFKMLDFSKKSS